MYHLHFKRNVRSISFLLIVVTVLAAIGTVWWANVTGMPESWRSAIEREISKQGAHIKIGGLTYMPLRGVVASNVRIFSDPLRLHEISRLESVLLDFDKTKLARGNFHVTKIELNKARLILPVDPDAPNSEILEITGVNGTLLMPGKRRFEVRDAVGEIQGIKVHIDARLIGYQNNSSNPSTPSQIGMRRQLIANALIELKKWRFQPDHAPELRVILDGNANDRSALRGTFELTAKGVEKNGYTLDDFSVQADITGDLVTLTSLKAEDSRGKFESQLDYDIDERKGRFNIHSSLEIPHLLKAWLGISAPKDILIGGRQNLSGEGEFAFNEANIPKINMTGHVRCDAASLRGVLFDKVESSFSWSEGELFLRDMHAVRPDGEAKGKVMIQWPLVRLAAESTLPSHVYKPFCVGLPLEKVIEDFTERKGAETYVKLEGGFDATDHFSWAYTGSGKVKNLSYKGVPVNSAECKFSLSHYELDFFDGTVVFNYQNYPLREAFDGPTQGTTAVGRIRYDAPNKIVEVENVSGTMWAAPLVRLFAPKVADTLEVYRFHTPPEMKGSGVVDVTPQGRTALDVSFKSKNPADYRFLGENITLNEPSGKVLIRGEQVAVNDLTLNAFDGPVSAQFNFRGKGKLEGELSWKKLSIPSLTSTYGFHMKGGGDITGRLEFSILDGRVETMNGVGLFALDRTELFSVPMFGPLSTVMSTVVNDKRTGYERAKTAFCDFKIKDGILSTRNFQTSTSSLTFLGDGKVDLKERTLDMTMRMNARGLFGLLTLPLRPLYGMFQFRGTGPLSDTKWENVMFTSPPPEDNELLMAPPKAKAIEE